MVSAFLDLDWPEDNLLWKKCLILPYLGHMNDEPLELGLGESAPVEAECLNLLLQAAPLTELVLNVHLKFKNKYLGQNINIE